MSSTTVVAVPSRRAGGRRSARAARCSSGARASGSPSSASRPARAHRPVRRPACARAVAGLPPNLRRDDFFSVPTTWVTTSFHGCSGVVAAWSGWHSSLPRSGSQSVPRSECSLHTAVEQPTTCSCEEWTSSLPSPDRLRAPLRFAPRPQARAHRGAGRTDVGAAGRPCSPRHHLRHRPPGIRRVRRADRSIPPPDPRARDPA